MQYYLKDNKEAYKFLRNKSINKFARNSLLLVIGVTFLVLSFINNFDQFGIQLFLGLFGVGLIAVSFVFKYYASWYFDLNWSYNRITFEKLKEINSVYNWIWISSIATLYYELKYMLPRLKVIVQEHSELDFSYFNVPLYLSIFKDNKWYAKLDRMFRISIQEIAIAGLLMALFMITIWITKFTVARVFNVSFEYLFVICFAYLFRYFKSMLLAFLADALSLFISGTIGTWYWTYAIVPVFIALLASLFFDFVEKNKKWAVIVSIIILVVAFSTLAGIFIWQINFNLNKNGMLRISETFGFRAVPVYVGYILFGLAIATLIFIIALSVIFLTKKPDNDKILYFITSFALITSVLVIARWVWGPYAFVKYWSYIGRYDVSVNLLDKYVLIMIPIIIRSLIVIPLYTYILMIMLVPLRHLRKNYMQENALIKW
ncbi:hypothetical protein ACJA23_02455 [Mycoplasma corogypsi]|uniref:hypothetical protein n=1 Tax=Mycoplasma corogypsi TaxID=2106 RepID=UPI003873105A